MVATNETKRQQLAGIQLADPAESRAWFDALARSIAGMSGDEFIRRWDAGELRDRVEADENGDWVRLYMLIPFGRADS